MSAAYTYQISDTANGSLNADKLDQEIEAAGPWSQTFDGISVFETTFETVFGGPITAEEKVNLDAIVAAHVGIVTEPFSTVIRAPDVSVNNQPTWVRRLLLPQTPPLARGWYRVEAYCMYSLVAAPADPSVDRAEVRLALDTGEGETQRAHDTWPFEHGHSVTLIYDVLAQHGDQLSGGLDFRPVGVGMSAEISEAVLTVIPLGINP